MPELIGKIHYRTLCFALVAVILFLVGYWPAITILVEKWATIEEYSHAFIVLPIVFYMVWVKRRELSVAPSKGTIAGFVLLIIAAPVYIFALFTQVHTIISLAMVLTIIGVIVFLGGSYAISILAMPLILIVLIIPLPDTLLIRVTFPLQLKVSQFSEIIISAIGIPIFREGNIMSIPGKSFEVVEACSGMRSLMTLITLALIVGYFLLKRLFSIIMLVLFSIPTAIFVNILRVVCMILAFHFLNLDLSQGVTHKVLGVALFCLSLLIFFLFQRILEHWERP